MGEGYTSRKMESLSQGAIVVMRIAGCVTSGFLTDHAARTTFRQANADCIRRQHLLPRLRFRLRGHAGNQNGASGSLRKGRPRTATTPMTMRETIASIWAWTVTGLLILAWFPMMAILWLLDRDPIRYRTGRFFRQLGALVTYVNPFWDIEVTGTPPADMRAPYVVVSNHLSHADVPIISRLPWEMKWVAKKELFGLPFVGWMMQMARDIAVDRGSRRSRAQVLVKGRKVLAADCPVMFFPEGTRSRDGRIHRFAEGPFRLAIREGVPVLPLAIDGTQDALPKHSWKFKDTGTTMRLKVLPPVETTGLTSEDAPALTERVRAQIAEQVAAWRGVPVAEVDAPHAGPRRGEAAGKESVNPTSPPGRSEPAS